ncbi:unnamed protein product [Linum tenue]|uniref:NB-ARC domain-containing protein n=1 Tax=Linum tenue TaxID=586396 RepID=A0AAV0IHL1_9ROSI|nr:unnamed protein product [Linum tenue]
MTWPMCRAATDCREHKSTSRNSRQRLIFFTTHLIYQPGEISLWNPATEEEKKMTHLAKQILGRMEDLQNMPTPFPCTFKGELWRLKDSVLVLQAVLPDAEQQQVYSHQVRDWLEKLSDTMYEVEHFLDDLSVEAHLSAIKDGETTFLVNSFPGALLYGVKMGRAIKAITEKLDFLRKDVQMFHLQVADRLEQPPPVALLSRAVLDEIVIGRQEEAAVITDKLRRFDFEAAGVSVFSIVGKGGLGKTTLAKLISENEAVKEHFGRQVWVNVSTRFNAKEILAKMLQSITRQSHAGLRLADLEVVLQEKIGGGRFLLVLDDVWEEGFETWKKLGQHLMTVGGAAGSKVLVTTRSNKVAEMASRAMMEPGTSTSMVETPYILRTLPLDVSFQFLMKSSLLLHGEGAQTEQVEGIAKEIAMICGGVPLAIREMASLLSLKDRKEWPSIVRGLQRNYRDGVDSMSVILQLCFNSIPSHLKLCLSCCSLFPRGHVFDIQSLTQLWEAQGYFEEGGSGNRQGLQCFEMLNRRSFFHDVEMDEFGNLATCRMYNWVYDLASMGHNGRHWSLSPNSESSSRFPTNIHPSLLRSILLGGQESSSASRRGWSMLKPLFPSLKSLSALDAHSSGIEQVPSSIRYLAILRYLDVSGNDAMEQLPESISELWQLQVLKLSGCTRLKQLPRNIRKLVNLKHLYSEGCWSLTHMPRGIGELTSLLTLTCFVLPKQSSPSKHMAAGLSELGSLKHLRGRLEIRNLGSHNSGGTELECRTSFLIEKQGLQSLSLCWDMDDGASADVKQQHEQTLECCQPPPGLKELEISEYGGEKFPSWLSSLKDLIRIKILDCPRCRSLPPLEEFTLLQSCTIDSLPKLEYIDSLSKRKHDSPLFPSLKEVYLTNCPGLKGWWEEGVDVTFPSFHCLSRLEIRDCPKLDQMPLFPTLEDKLLVEYSSLAPLQQTIQHQEEASSSFSPLSRLKSLWILSIEELQVLPEQWLQKLPSLQELLIEFCPKLSFLPPGMRRLTSLRVLDVHRCPQLTQRCGSNKAVDWPNIAHITNIRIDKKLIQLGGRYQLSEKDSIAAIANFSFVHPLSKITSVTVESLESLPAEWVQNLSTLKELKIVNSPSIDSWPQELRSVTHLERLQISGCATLEEMCIEDKDCSAIAHVPFVQAGDRVVRPRPR